MQALRQYRAIRQHLQAQHQRDADGIQKIQSRPDDAFQLARKLTDISRWQDGDDHEEPIIAIPASSTEHSERDIEQGICVNRNELTPVPTPAKEHIKDVEIISKSPVFVVGWTSADPDNPRNWSTARRMTCTLIISAIAFVCTIASSIDTAISKQAAATFHVSSETESLATALFLVGCAVGSLFMGPFSETFGRCPVYIVGMFLFMTWIMASGLAPNIGAQIAFRFLAGVFSCAPLTCAGGSMSDLWTPAEKSWSFTYYAIPAYGGPILGPVVGGYMYTNVIPSWRWTEWITLITSGGILAVSVWFMPETHPGTIQTWKAKHLRAITGDKRFVSRSEVFGLNLLQRMKKNLTRPFVLATEPIVVSITIWLSMVYAVLFVFFDGYESIFKNTYRLTQGLTNTIFAALYVGTMITAPLTWLIWRWIWAEMARSSATVPRPETRLWISMLAGPWAMSVSLFWLGWTSFPSITVWSPILATSLFGLGLLSSFLSATLYLIDAYETNVASALTFATTVRYLIAGGMTVAGIPFFEEVSHHWVCSVLGFASLVCIPIPYVLYRWGPLVRKNSPNCLNKS